ncbi:MAG: GTP pyrophosphokinase family protein [Clostridiales bacterium]|nr:GTP pyrophosphokinase family protein [Clostridiales bacterium]
MEQSFYKESIVLLEGAENEIKSRLATLRSYLKSQNVRDPIEHFTSRIKDEESMKEKLQRKGLEVTLEAALTQVYDAVGVRVICSYINDIYTVRDILKKQDDMEIISEKDYIKNPKPNGYRSYHMIVKIPVRVGENKLMCYAEIQLRTIAMDCWASLEHLMKYKKNIKNQELIVSELKRCADEIASTDITMQTIHDLIQQ